MTEFFQHIRGGFSLHVDGEDIAVTNVRFILGRHGEDITRLISAFWKECRGDFEIVPLFCYGGAPRKELCTGQLLAAALQTADIEPGNRDRATLRAWAVRLTMLHGLQGSRQSQKSPRG